MIAEYDEGYLTGLDFLWLEITPQCNLHCTHCYAESSPGNALSYGADAADWRKTMTQAFNAGCRQVQFIGGEPTLHPGLPELITGARNLGYEFVEVFTNGTRLNTPTGDLLLDTFERCKVSLAFSFYSWRAGIHDCITGRPGSFARTLAGLKSAVARSLAIRVGIIAMDENRGDVERTVSFLNDLGVSAIRVDRLRGIGRGQSLLSAPSLTEELCGECWRGKLCVDSRGDVSPCVFSKFYSVGHISEGIDKILASDRLLKVRAEIYANKQKQSDTGPSGGTKRACGPDTKPCGPECTPACSPCGPKAP